MLQVLFGSSPLGKENDNVQRKVDDILHLAPFHCDMSSVAVRL